MDRQSSHAAPDGAVMFADICGSTRLFELAGDSAALGAVGECLRVMKSCSAALHGRVVKTIGDEVMVLFSTAENALQAALDMQQAVSEQPRLCGMPMSLHIGFHHGPLLSDGAGDVFGDTVNLAARLSKLASRGQIITSGDSVARLPVNLRHLTRYLYPIQVRGREHPVELFEAIWQQVTDLTLVAPGDPFLSVAGLLTLRHGETLIEVRALSGPVTIGRDPGMTIVVSDRRASRFQATIEFRGGRYVLIDRSSNGTHVRIDGAEEFILRRDEITLWQHGWITFGQSVGDTGEYVEFFVSDERG